MIEPELNGSWFREQLHLRRNKLRAVPQLQTLLREVDDALYRLDHGSFGACETCHESIEGGRLLADPLTRVCLGCLTQGQQRALEHDLELAARAQRALLPDELVRARGWEIAHRYRPLGPVSGDYCDVLLPETPEGAVWFLLGDVSGKGVAASILMGHLQALFRSLVGADVGPAAVAERANRILGVGFPASSFSTLLLGRSFPDGQVEICNAGHDPARLVRRGSVRPLPATGLPLGLFSESRYETTRFRMDPGDSLLLYTDGLAESENDEGQAYGCCRLEAFLAGVNGAPAGNVLDDWLDDVERFRGTTGPADDVTVMLVRRNDEGGAR